VPDVRSIPPPGPDEGAAVAPVPAADGDVTDSRQPGAPTRRPPLWWTGGALGSALRAGRLSAWLAIGGLIAVVIAAAAR
jgi:hypothetical protein